METRALLHLGRDGQARDRVQRLLAEHPESEQLWRLHAIASARLRDFAVAWQSSREAVRLAPSEWRTHYVAAQVDLWAGHPYADTWNRALEAVRLSPGNPEAHLLFGNVALAMKDLRSARQAYEETLRLDPQNAVARQNLGVVAIRMGDTTAAAAGFAGALGLDANVANAQRNLLVVTRIALNRVQLIGVGVMFAVVALVMGASAESGRVQLTCRLVAFVLWSGALAGAALYLRRAVRSGGAPLRGFLRAFPRRSPDSMTRVVLLAVALVALLAIIVAPFPFAVAGVPIAFLSLIICNLISWVQRFSSP
ncbi:hypothetical protein GCM10022286_12320 [Gryllotalpicola daejeonensis]|uniref:Tetratricopeptide repeat protein n=1 Tax=Gryllotalpicola daejeonensis TaxID=993087 RepID=A0ABP7ZIR7_9MICO